MQQINSKTTRTSIKHDVKTKNSEHQMPSWLNFAMSCAPSWFILAFSIAKIAILAAILLPKIRDIAPT